MLFMAGMKKELDIMRFTSTNNQIVFMKASLA